MNCPRCKRGQMGRNYYGEPECLQCGHIVYPPVAAVDERPELPPWFIEKIQRLYDEVKDGLSNDDAIKRVAKRVGYNSITVREALAMTEVTA